MGFFGNIGGAIKGAMGAPSKMAGSMGIPAPSKMFGGLNKAANTMTGGLAGRAGNTVNRMAGGIPGRAMGAMGGFGNKMLGSSGMAYGGRSAPRPSYDNSKGMAPMADIGGGGPMGIPRPSMPFGAPPNMGGDMSLNGAPPMEIQPNIYHPPGQMGGMDFNQNGGIAGPPQGDLMGPDGVNFGGIMGRFNRNRRY